MKFFHLRTKQGLERKRRSGAYPVSNGGGAWGRRAGVPYPPDLIVKKEPRKWQSIVGSVMGSWLRAVRRAPLPPPPFLTRREGKEMRLTVQLPSPACGYIAARRSRVLTRWLAQVAIVL